MNAYNRPSESRAAIILHVALVGLCLVFLALGVSVGPLLGTHAPLVFWVACPILSLSPWITLPELCGVPLRYYLKGAYVVGMWRCLSCVYWQLRRFGVLVALLVVHVTTQKAFEATVCFREWMKREKE